VKYQQYIPLAKEADVLLFRGQSIISRFIQRASESIYSHVAVASKYNGTVECIEFREGKGGRTVNLEEQVRQNNGKIDVYRPSPFVVKTVYDSDYDRTQLSIKHLKPKEITRSIRS
jgi:hypothetical protein